jgi:lipopolysaccharide transport system ATP-binding protein
MSNIAIHTENLGKRYQLGATVDFSRTFREAILGLPNHFYRLTKSKAQRLLDKTEYTKDTPKGTFWALRDINLDIQHGDVVGIIGRNGAGKSTLLKILSKITSPTTGIARINGRVGSLLEVGTGFHPELTGRENIYLNGSILGMRKAEIEKKFDEIVAFAEVEQFLDTPIKRYSSGMQVRLAFAVAAHLEPEILIVDEVLAVGDAAFQKKCLGKMEDVSKEGRTVLFVSHNMGAVKNICRKGIVLEKGLKVFEGQSDEALSTYLNEIYNKDDNPYDNNPVIRKEFEIKTGGPKITEVLLSDQNGNLINKFKSTEQIFLKMKINPSISIDKDYFAAWFLYDSLNQQIAVGASYPIDNIFYSKDTKLITCKIEPEALIPGKYILKLVLYAQYFIYHDLWEKAIAFEITENDYHNTGYNYPGIWESQYFIKNTWLKENENQK